MISIPLQNCGANSGGPRCERCSDGFYGDPNYPAGCEPCPCPETNRNFARGCTVLNRRVACICRPGYAGALCDRCAVGYFGQPIGNGSLSLTVVGQCAACDCDPDGTDAAAGGGDCDRLTGQCVCRPGLLGRRCDRCDARRSTLQAGQCRVCDNCTLTLLDRTDALANTFDRGIAHLDPNAIPAPWLKLLAAENVTHAVGQRVVEATAAANSVRHFDATVIEKLESRGAHLAKRQFRLAERANPRSHRADQTLADVAEQLAAAQQCSADILQTVDVLNTYGLHTHYVNLPAAAHEAQLIVDDLRRPRPEADAAEATLRCARTHFNRWQTNAGILSNQADELQSLEYNASLTNGRLEAAARLAALAADTVATARDKHGQQQRSFDMLRDHEQLIRKLKAEVLEALNGSEATRLDGLLQEYEDTALKVRTDGATVRRLADLVEQVLEEEADDVAELLADRVPLAEEHAAELTRRANEYARLFVNTRNGAELALRASSAHATIGEAIGAAADAAGQAVEAVRTSEAELHENAGGEEASIVDRGMGSLRKSSRVETTAAGEFRRLDGEGLQMIAFC